MGLEMYSKEGITDRIRAGDEVLVMSIADFGPHAGIPIATFARRKEVVELVAEIQESPSKLENALDSIKSSVKSALSESTDPTENTELMDDLILMFCALLATGYDSETLEDSGLMTVSLWIDEDASLSWQQRGMLDPDLIKGLGISDEPMTMM